ncbi:MAG: hypothetical protein IPJ27_02185 [Candidatus Accumulibacter sp.]|uniref:Uncharacterized protein n=1 Tax=Candidatus Accumulibacter proximus TaxID=2954385 RepID=A0A935UE80_9PROT|nr:hypothetical protein [Candidatus Accumulibacter proximus]
MLTENTARRRGAAKPRCASGGFLARRRHAGKAEACGRPAEGLIILPAALASRHTSQGD